MMAEKKLLRSVFVVMLTLLNTAYAIAQNNSAVTTNPDYGNLDNWAAHPWKHDASDSVPKPLRADYHPDSAVDIFFIHPTTYTDFSQPFGWNAPVDNAELNKATDNRAILNQASVFNAAGRVFAPRYRQANLKAYYTQDTANARAALDTAYSDVKAAFEYYMQHFNNGRPVIIASHSQGTTHAKKLLKEFFDGKPLQQKLVAAYIVGIAVEPTWFSTLQPCTKPTQAGCFCTWRTMQTGFLPGYVQNEQFTAVVTNPLTWDADKPDARRQDNQGSVLLNFNKLPKHVAGATIHGGVLWTAKPHFFGNIFFTNKNYHIADYNLYYVSIRENLQQRIKAYRAAPILPN
jgi:hypothetical protein